MGEEALKICEIMYFFMGVFTCCSFGLHFLGPDYFLCGFRHFHQLLELVSACRYEEKFHLQITSRTEIDRVIPRKVSFGALEAMATSFGKG